MVGNCDYCGDKTEVYNVVQPNIFGGPSTTISVCTECMD